MAANNSDSPHTRGRRQIPVRFEDTSASYATQFVINASDEELIVGFSTGLLESGDGGPAVLPVQSRVAMTRPAAARLVRLLAGALRRADHSATTGSG